MNNDGGAFVIRISEIYDGTIDRGQVIMRGWESKDSIRLMEKLQTVCFESGIGIRYGTIIG